MYAAVGDLCHAVADEAGQQRGSNQNCLELE